MAGSALALRTRLPTFAAGLAPQATRVVSGYGRRRVCNRSVSAADAVDDRVYRSARNLPRFPCFPATL